MQNGTKSKIGSILLGIGAVCVVLRLVTKGPGWTLGAVVFLLVGAIVDGASRKRYQRVLSASMCERLLAVQQCIGKGWICLLSDGLVSVVADTGSGLFDGTGSGAEALRKEYTGALMQARRVMDALQLPGAQ